MLKLKKKRQPKRSELLWRMQQLERQNQELLQTNQLLRSKVREISFLHGILTDLIKTCDFEGTVEAILDMAMKITGSEAGLILQAHRTSDRLQVIAARGEFADAVTAYLQRHAHLVQPCFVSQVVKLNCRHPAFSPLQQRDVALRSLMAVPLQVDQAVIGVLILMHRHQGQDDHCIEYTDHDRKTVLAFAGQAAFILDNTRMKIEYGRQDVYLKSISALSSAIDAKDAYTRNHSRNVARYAVALGEGLGLSGEELTHIHFGAILHDIGKIGVPEYILNKPGRLSQEEFQAIKEHPATGARILAPIDFLKESLNVVLYHHERYDGSGYPEGLKGESIPYTARLVSIADAWDAMTSQRSYRAALPVAAAVRELQQAAGTQFDPVMVKVFTDLVKHNPAMMCAGDVNPG
ncbi:HD-GYP domain-containing protein [Desulforamulus hydrothermalis]|uniref:Metal dependent phosphohydrolase n=1 Tax=Desulforamulus hydrothermalis Lam5 = DSM 18033 TaxID=1121428 RepID=K8DZ06_9FIRM|nr:HD domain-containing phosphohydrolase [Desulforamulus hydrothermalis]CCO08184.1 Metal dependent phosphohydrolase [Desulforamulus hydrothermalis Lam5 = DSM 18033]SHH22981.1 HDIG domain-containing protein [Desulforamulus hydrothermalis Lam5 = DSM 18033]